MRRFIYALAMLLLTLWNRTWKKVFRSQRSFLTTALVAGMLLTGWVGVRTGGGPAPATGPAPSTTPSAAAGYRTTTAEPIDGSTDSSTSTASPRPASTLSPADRTTDGGPSVEGGPQAAQGGGALETSPQPVPAPTQPSADPDKAAEVAQAWATSYLSRHADHSEQWQQWMAPYIVPELAAYLTDSETEQDNPIAERAPSAVTEVTIGKTAPHRAPADTPVRWTRSIDVAVATADGRTTTLTYELTLNKTDEGWKVRNALENGWTTKATR